MGRTGRVGICLVTALTALGLAPGCGSKRPPPGESQGFIGAAGGGGGFSDAGSDKPPGCGQKDDGTFCDCLDAPLYADAPNIYFVLDRSGSMSVDDKWDQVRVTLGHLMRAIGPRANFGATVFPGFADESCAAPSEIMSVRPGDPPSASSDGPTTRLLLSATSSAPYGGTPTSEALRSVLPRLQKLPGKTFVLLATDGAPNCNAQASCSADKCIANIENVPGCPPGGPPNCCDAASGAAESCLDDGPANTALTALKSAGFLTYVVGIPGSGPYAGILDSFAVSGGTATGAASPKYYRVDASGEQALLAALKKIAAKIIATCEFKLKEPPKDPDAVNVYLDEAVVPADPTSGWKIDGDTVTLVGDTCARVLNGDVLDVRIIVGCPTIKPR